MYLFIGLYSLYGVVHGLCNAVQLLVADGDNILQNTLSAFAWSPIIAFLAAPVVEAIHVPYVGRRKTWIVGSQFAIGAIMLLMLPISGYVENDTNLPFGINSAVLALYLGMLNVLAAVHEIATDAWGKSYIHHKYDFTIHIHCNITSFIYTIKYQARRLGHVVNL